MNKTPTKTKHKAFWIAASIAVFLGAVTFMITQDMVLMSQVWQSVTLPNLMTAATLIMLMHLAMTLRWYWAAKYLDIPLSFTKALFIFPYSMLGALTLDARRSRRSLSLPDASFSTGRTVGIG